MFETTLDFGEIMENRREIEIAIIKLESELAKQREKFANPVPLSGNYAGLSLEESEKLGVLVALTVVLKEFKKTVLNSADQN